MRATHDVPEQGFARMAGSYTITSLSSRFMTPQTSS